MKKILLLLLGLILVISSLAGCSSETASDEEGEEEEEDEEITLTVSDPDYYTRFKDDNISINVYNWGEYISDGEDGTLDVNAEFTKLTGIEVNYTTFATNEEMYAKLKGGGVSYDVIIPSDYMISRMIEEDMLLPLDLDNIPNLSNIMEKFLYPEYDPDNAYSVPYTWGTVGILYDTTVVDLEPEEIDWDILWNPDYIDEILMFDNPRDAFMIAEVRLGYSINTTDPKELEAAADLLKEQKSVVQAYVMDEIFDKMGGGEAVLAPYYAGDALVIMEDNEDLNFVIPESGTNLFFDAMCIPSSSKQKEAAEMYINFMCEPDIAYSTAVYIGYSTPNQAAYEMLDDEVKNDGISYLDDEYLAEHTEVYCNLTTDANQEMQDLWTEMKSAEDTSSNQWIVPAFMAGCIIASIAILIHRHIKAKKDIF